MEQLKQLKDRIVSRVNANLSEFEFNTESFVLNSLEYDKMLKFYAFYGITSQHPLYFHFVNSNIAGSYFLGKCYVGRSAIYKSDIRGDELKREGETIRGAKNIPLVEDELIFIKDSLLYKTLVHSNSHNPESPEEFGIRNTVSAHYSNIHGSTLEGCFLGPFATVDIMNLHSCIVGNFSYVQAGELFHRKINSGTVWYRTSNFEFKYKFDKKILDSFVGVNEAYQPRGLIYDFVKQREHEYEKIFDVMNLDPVKAPDSSAVNRFAVVKGKTKIGENVLISQRAFLEDADVGDGSNAQENSYIINSTLSGLNVTTHGGKLLYSKIGLKTYIGFNAILNGRSDATIEIGDDCIVMPHTIINPNVSIKIPSEYLIWGYIRSEEDVESHTIPIDDLAEVRDRLKIGTMVFKGNGSIFIDSLRKRINQVLSANGALFANGENRGHAQDDQNISFNIIQPYATGPRKGLFPSIRIKP